MENPQEHVIDRAQDPAALMALALHWGALRSQVIVGQALAKAFPTGAKWEDFLNSDDFLELAEELSVVVQDIRQVLEVQEAVTPDQVQEVVGQHSGRAMYAVAAVADFLEVSGEDLLTASVS